MDSMGIMLNSCRGLAPKKLQGLNSLKAYTGNLHRLSCCRDAQRRQRAAAGAIGLSCGQQLDALANSWMENAAGCQLQQSLQNNHKVSALTPREPAQSEPFRRRTGDIVS